MVSAPSDEQIIRNCDLFRGVPDTVVQDVVADRTPISLNKGQLLFHQGDAAEAFFVILEGWMKLYRVATDGREIIIHVSQAGETFAEAAMFMEGVYPVHAEAVTAVRLQKIYARNFREAVAANPTLAFAMLGAMSLRLRRLVNEIEGLKRRSAPEALAEFLLGLTEGCATDQCNVVLPFEKALIAARLGFKPESLSRAIARLRELGVEVDGASVSISSRQTLARFVASPTGV